MRGDSADPEPMFCYISASQLRHLASLRPPRARGGETRGGAVD